MKSLALHAQLPAHLDDSVIDAECIAPAATRASIWWAIPVAMLFAPILTAALPAHPGAVILQLFGTTTAPWPVATLIAMAITMMVGIVVFGFARRPFGMIVGGGTFAMGLSLCAAALLPNPSAWAASAAAVVAVWPACLMARGLISDVSGEAR